RVLTVHNPRVSVSAAALAAGAKPASSASGASNETVARRVLRWFMGSPRNRGESPTYSSSALDIRGTGESDVREEDVTARRSSYPVCDSPGHEELPPRPN